MKILKVTRPQEVLLEGHKAFMVSSGEDLEDTLASLGKDLSIATSAAGAGAPGAVVPPDKKWEVGVHIKIREIDAS